MTPAELARQSVLDARTVYNDAMVRAPRSQQKRLGPSQLGNGCDRCLVHMLAGTEEVRQGPPPWLPTVGTAVHAWAEQAMIDHLAASGSTRWLPETKVTVGELRGEPVTGTADLFDRDLGVVIDLKVVGEYTRKKVRADGSGTPTTYRNQIQMYGRGLARAGEEVNAVAIYFIARNGTSLAVDRVYAAPYDEQVAVAALDRADQFASFVDTFGAKMVLDSVRAHTGTEFSCTKWGDGAPARPVTADQFLGV